MIFFTSDTHFQHKNICGPSLSTWKNGYRTFSSISEMNNTLIDNINNVVGPNDKLYHLGDFSFGDRSKIPSIRESINCNFIYLLKGNHDNNIENYSNCFEWIKGYDEFFVNNTLITMMHYPVASWNGIGHGAFNLHGHCHGKYPPIGKQLDVGVDNPLNLYMPWSIDKVFNHMQNIEVVTVDHHYKYTNIR